MSTSNIIEVDLSKIDNEIADIERKISDLQKERQTRLDIKKYVQGYSVSKNDTDTIAPARKNGGVSEFILSTLNGSKLDTKVIIQAYADSVGKPLEDVRNNISNALSRLKSDGKINNELNSGGRKAGSRWFLV